MSAIRLRLPFARLSLGSRGLTTSIPRRLAGATSTTGPSTDTPDPSGTPRPTQGHTTTKPEGLDVQSDNAQAGQRARGNASGGKGQGPIDAASMDGGQAKSGTEGTGAFKDQVGGQPSGGDVQKVGKTEVPGGGWTGKVSKALGGNKAFHTSARALLSPSLPSLYSSSPRQPVESESDLHGEQNPHLKHKSPSAPEGDSGKGNAADDPHLPSKKQSSSSSGTDAGSSGNRDGAQSQSTEQTRENPAQSGKASGAPKGFAAYHTSARRLGEQERKGPGYAGTHTGEANRAGKNAPPEALPPNLESNYNRAESTPPAPNMTPSSEAEYSSTATSPPNDALREAVKQGGQSAGLDLGRNAQPDGEMGKKGLGEAWKERK